MFLTLPLPNGANVCINLEIYDEPNQTMKNATNEYYEVSYLVEHSKETLAKYA